MTSPLIHMTDFGLSASASQLGQSKVSQWCLICQLVTTMHLSLDHQALPSFPQPFTDLPVLTTEPVPNDGLLFFL